MLDNFILGGQIFLHNVAMFKQVVGKSFAASLLASMLISGYVSFDKLSDLDFHAGASYVKAHVNQWLHDNRLILHRDANRTSPKIDAYYKEGLYMKSVNTGYIIRHSKFKSAYRKIETFVLEVLALATSIATCITIVIFLIWTKFGKSAKTSRLINGDTVLSAKEVAGYLNANKLASPFVIGDMPLIKDQETRHILITGMTGSGKTNLLHTFFPQIRDKNQPALVIDQTGEMIARYYNPERGDVIFNPFDARSYSWDFWTEVESNQRLNSLATSIFCSTKSVEAVWNNASRQVFIDSVSKLTNRPDRSLRQLYHLIATMSLRDASRILEGTASSSLLDPLADKTAMSIRMNAIAFLGWIECLPEVTTTHNFAIKNWVADTITSDSGRWLFVSGLAEERSVLQPLQSILLELTVLSLQKLIPNQDRRFWLIVDELSSLKKLHALPQGLAELRKYGGCIVAGLQSLNQLFDLYGSYQGSTMFGQFATKFIFRNDEPAMARLITEMIGSAQYLEHNKNTSYGANEHRDGVSYSEEKRYKQLVTASDLSKLANLECYVHLPTPEARIAKITMPFVPAPKKLEEGFLPVEQGLNDSECQIDDNQEQQIAGRSNIEESMKI
jgi:type IV conjugative transfer system coupling protein TraD